MQRVLIVSPHFPPSNAADIHRVRLVLPYLALNGWEAEVIAASPDCVAGPRDDWLSAPFLNSVKVHRVNGLGLSWSRIPSFGQLYPRIRGEFRKIGDALLNSKRFDLIYFSTTQFPVHKFGPYWKRKFRVPFVMDYQDPWVHDYYQRNPKIGPPGGRLKYAIVRWLGKQLEPRVLRQCSGITSVSNAYPIQLKERYPFLTEHFPTLVVPFPGDDLDLQRVRDDASIRQDVFDPNDGLIHWVYIGVAGQVMHRALRGLFAAIQEERRVSKNLDKNDLSRLLLHFVGTSYAAGKGQKSVEPLAREYGLQDMVVEQTNRIPYSQTLRCLLDADALIVPGSDDYGYTASKIYPYLLARRPLLTVFHEKSSVNELIQKVGGAISVPFSNEESSLSLGKRIQSAWLKRQSYMQPAPFDEVAFAPYTAREQAKKLAGFFRKVLIQPTEYL